MTTDTPFRYLGHKTDAPTKSLDTFSAPNVAEVSFTSSELTAFCPVTHQPDFYTVSIRYAPGALCVESKSLKLYLQSFRDTAQFAEAMAAEIADDLFSALSPKSVEVGLTQQVRGGLVLKVTARRGDV